MAETKIEWCDHSINPIRATRVWQRHPTGPPIVSTGHYCEKISSGCAHCYASRLQPRFQMPQFPGVTPAQRPELDGVVVPNGARPYLDEKALDQIRRRRKPTRYFVCDMTDPFGWWVHNEWLDAMFATFTECRQHTFMLLTKRPQRMAEYFAHELRPDAVRIAAEARGVKVRGMNYAAWPLDNVWLGVSAENQKTWDDRVSVLATIPAALRFVSVEPMLEAIEMNYPPSLFPGGPQYCCNGWECGCQGLPTDPPWLWEAGISWIIFGGESGQRARPCNVDWIRSGLAQCKAANVKAFVKQLGAKPIWPNVPLQTAVDDFKDFPESVITHSKGGAMEEWPVDLRVREMPAGQGE